MVQKLSRPAEVPLDPDAKGVWAKIFKTAVVIDMMDDHSPGSRNPLREHGHLYVVLEHYECGMECIKFYRLMDTKTPTVWIYHHNENVAVFESHMGAAIQIRMIFEG